MSLNIKETHKMKVFPKGQVVIPVHLRKKYHIDIGDNIEVISQTNGILLKPEKKEGGKKLYLTDRLFGFLNKYSAKEITISKNDITQAAKSGFTKGWKE